MSTLPTDTNVVATATLTVPVLSRGLDNTLTGQGSVTVIGSRFDPVTQTTTAINFTYQVQVVGTVSGKKSRPRVAGSIYTIDSRGRRVKQGLNSIFEGNFN